MIASVTEARVMHDHAWTRPERRGKGILVPREPVDLVSPLAQAPTVKRARRLGGRECGKGREQFCPISLP